MTNRDTAQMKNIYEKERNDPTLEDYTQLLFDIALIGEGGKIENPSKFSKIIGQILMAS